MRLQRIVRLVPVPEAVRLAGVSVILALGFFFSGTTTRAQIYASAEEFQQDYDAINATLLSTEGEIAKVQDFVYRKDAATFTFSEGHFLLRRPVAGRPTEAIFVGKGSVSIPIPLEVERRCLEIRSGNTAVNESFDACYIRFTDNLDSLLRERFTFSSGRLSRHDTQFAKRAQDDFSLRPLRRHRFDVPYRLQRMLRLRNHPFDNSLQLLQTVRTRPVDGFFWARFNRFVFTYDPSRAEEVAVYYDLEPWRMDADRGARFPRASRIELDPLGSNGVEYPTVCVRQHTQMELGGSTGYRIMSALSKMSLLVNKDLTGFVSVFLHENLKVDSVLCEGQPAPYKRLQDFDHLAIALPKTCVKGDTIDIIIKYHGKDYTNPFPWVENPANFPHTLGVKVPQDYDYMFSGIADTVDQSDGFVTVDVQPGRYLDAPFYIARLTGWDTLSIETAFGLLVHCAIPETQTRKKLARSYSLLDHEAQECFLRAMDFMYDLLGHPPLSTDLYVTCSGWSVYSRTGHIVMPAELAKDEYGGLSITMARAAAGQWFSSTTQPASYREQWIIDALPGYLADMFAEADAGIQACARNRSFDGEAFARQDKKEKRVPLACSAMDRSSKGFWVLRMLRNLMNTTSPTKDQTFKAWLRDVVQQASAGRFTNKDLQNLAEKHFGFDLSSFFDKWLYDTGIIDYKIDYSISPGDDGYYLDMKVVTTGVSEEYLSPVLICLETEDGPLYFDSFITPKVTHYQYGPFAEKPTKFLFNKCPSVLSKEKISKVDDASR